MSAPLLDGALALAGRGWPVFPCRGQVPRTRNGLKDATTDPGMIAGWWEQWPDADVAVACGAGLLVLDVDPRHGGDQSLAELEAVHGELPETEEVATGGGGRHLYFAVGQAVRNSVGKVGAGLDIRGDGGYVICPPSIHASGTTYEWASREPVDPAPAPQWLLDAASGQQLRTGAAPPVGDTIPAGGRNAELASLAGSMRRRGMSAGEIEGALTVTNRDRCRPPLDAEEVRAIAASISRYEPAAPRRAPQKAQEAQEAPQGGEEPQEAAQQLSTLLALDTVGLSVHGARIVGSGGEASADLYLSNRVAITFQTLRDFGKPGPLAFEIAIATGAIAKINGPAALRAVSLLHTIAQHHESDTEDDIAFGWGSDFLAAAQTIDADWSNQAERWEAFARLRRTDPFSAARAEGTSLAAACLVFRGVDGSRFVRTSWLRGHVRQDSGVISPGRIANAMMRVGWHRPGKEGRITARQPKLGGKDVQCFYIVPPGWPEGEADEGTKADEGSHSHAHARAHPLILRQPSSPPQRQTEGGSA